MSVDLTTRPLAERDRPVWDELWGIYLDFYGEQLAPEVTEATWRRVLHREQGLGGIVACVGEEVVGFAHHVIHPNTWGTGGVCYLEDLIVHPDHRGTGVGRRLIEALTFRAKEVGCTSVYWITQEDNEVARRLYDRVATRSPYVRYEIDLG